ncbi:MAG TPA: phosphatase PAP2 family protein [Vicinamibacteria bacterium]|nr:phosphatase PAP2 family protein [Vicinamibacteria bacterium]
METDLLLWIHRHATPALDAAARLAWLLGAWRLCAPLVIAAVAWHLARRERREALAWLAVGAAVALLPELVKAVVGRPRPTLWPWLLPTSGYAFPSGHAVAGAAFYPLLGWLALRGLDLGRAGCALGLVVAAFVGVGRLYVGVHWPSDVVAGWAIGAALALGAIRWLGPPGPRATRTAPPP